MSAGYAWRRLESAADLEPEPPFMAPDEAQEWCNFVLWHPTRLPDGCTVANTTLRREAPPGRVEGVTAGRTPWSTNNPCAYRYEIAGPGRTARVKQFLYDWAFPALDHPSLWKSNAHAVALDERYVVWIGVDYRGNRAAAARLARTTIELSVLSGQFTDDELVDVFRGLRPVDRDAAGRIAATPFAELSYWARHLDAPMIDVPHGLWAFRRAKSNGSDHEGAWSVVPGELDLDGAGDAPVRLGGLTFDSAATFDGEAGREVEAVYSDRVDRGHELRLITHRLGRGRIGWPPAPEPHPASRETVHMGTTEVMLAWVDRHYGPFDAVFLHHGRGLVVKLLSSAGVGLDRPWFDAALTELVEQLDAGPDAH
jgi:hypothetical protein